MFSYETQGTNTYLVYEILEDTKLDSLTLGMLINNKIKGFVPIFYTQINDRKLLKYNVTAKIPCSQYFAGTVNKKQMLGVFKSILAAAISAEEYMIEVDSLFFDLDYIFVNVSSSSAEVVCLPIMISNGISLVNFFKNIVFSTQYNQNENCDYVAQIISYLNSKSGFQIGEFYDLICQLDGDKPKAQEKPAPQQAAQPAAQVQPQAPSMYSQTNQAVQPARSNVQPMQPTNQVQGGSQAGMVNNMNNTNMGNMQPNRPAMPPQQPPVQQPAAQPVQQPEEQGDKISFMTLMMHYNKENKEKYKKQKELEKERKNSGQGAAAPAAGFAIPGVPEAGPQSVSGKGPSQPVNIQKPPQPSQPAGGNMYAQVKPQQQSIPQQQAMPQQQVMPPQQNFSQPAPQSFSQPMQPQAPAGGFGDTTVLNQPKSAAPDTTILSEYNKQTGAALPYLIRKKNNDKVVINKNLIRMGKERSYVDYFIPDNTAVSRAHANIVSRDGSVYVVDTNSTNHTYVNDQIIQSNVEIKLNDGDEVRLANEVFTFHTV